MGTLGHVIMCPLSRFLYHTRSIYFTGLSDGVSVYVHGQYAHLSLDTWTSTSIFSILYNLYDSMIVWWVLIRGFMILAYLFMFKCYSLMHLYIDVHVCVCRHFHVVPLCSRHDLITLRFHYLGPLLPSSLASQDYMVWYLRCVAAQPFLNVCMVSLITSDLSFYAPFLSIRVSFLLWNTWSILYRLYSNLIMSLLGRSYGAKLVMT